ncbi:MAG: restriction endonuclease subunit S [Syntrophales bacterium]
MKAVEGWTTEQLGSVIKDIGDGGTPNTNKREYFGGSVPWVVIQDIRKSISTTKTTLTRLGLASCSAKLWPAGSVILSTGATIGEVGLAEVPVATKQGIHGIVCKEEELSSQYLYYKLQTLRDFLNANAQGSTIREIRANFLRTISISFPTSKTEQTKIAEILSTVDRAIEQTEGLITKQQRIKTGLMQDLLTRGIDEHGNLRSESTHQFKDSPLGRIPVEWEIKSFGEIIGKYGGVLQTGPFGSQLHSYEYVADGVPVVMPQDIASKGISTANIARITEKKAQSLTRHRMVLDDLVFARRGDLSRCAVIGEKERGWLCGTGCLLMRPPAKVLSPRWTADAYRFHPIQLQVDVGAVGSTMSNLNTGILSDIRLALPQVEEQINIENLLQDVDYDEMAVENRLQKLRSLKTALMQDLLTGKKRVTPLLGAEATH